jgi:tetratricopeptide (TPR) repeat protein
MEQVSAASSRSLPVSGDEILPEISTRDRRLFLAILLIALAVRIAYLVDIHDSPYFSYPVLDSFWYDTKAADVLNGDLLASSGSFRVPLYTYFIAGCYAVFGQGYWTPLLIQAFLGALTCALMFAVARRLFGLLAGIVAGLGFAFYRMAIFSDGELLPTTIFMLFMLAAVYFALESIERKSVTRGLLVGLFIGLAFLTRPDILPFAVALVVVVIALLRVSDGLRVAVSICVPLVALMLLLGYRNHLAFGEFYLFSPQGAVNLYIGNAGYADGKTPVAPPTRYPYQITADPSEDSITLGCKQAATESVGRELSDRELSRYYVRKTFGEIRNDFPRWTGLIFKKVYYFLNSYERSDIKPIPRFIERHSYILRLPLVSYAVVMPLGIVGLAVSIARRKKLAWIVGVGFLAYVVNSLMFFVIWRYRLPAVPFLAMLAGYAVSEVWAAARARAYKTLALMLVPAVVLGGVSVSRFLDIAVENGAVQYIVNEAALFMKAGQHERATETYLEAVEAEPVNPSIYYFLGKAYATRGLLAESKEAMERSVALNPIYRPFAHLTLGVALVNAGSFEAAVSHFEKALAADSQLGLAAYNLGLCMMNLGRIDEAEKTFTRAEFLCKDDGDALVGIALAYVRMGMHDRGISLAQRLLRDDPHNPEALYAVGLGLEAKGRMSEAVAYFEQPLKYMPSSQELRRKIHELKAQQLMR